MRHNIMIIIVLPDLHKPHYENEDMPFELPKGWEWCRLGDICNYGDCKSASVDSIPNNTWTLELEDIEKDSGKILSYITKQERNIKGVRHSFSKGMILYSKLRTYLNKVLVAEQDGYCTTEIIPIKVYCDINPYYICYVLRSPYFLSYTEMCGYGVKMPRLSTSDATNAYIPLPPSKEQNRIIQEIKKFSCLIDNIEQDKTSLNDLVEQAKSKILDLAIHGKLVPQNPNDEPAIELLRKINPKFQPCDKEHYPFMIPSNWCWGSIKDIVKPMVKSKPCNKTFKYIDIDSINNKKNICQPKIINTEKAPSRATRYTQKNDVLFSMVRPYLRNISLVAEDECIASTGFYVCSPHDGIESKYLFYLIISSYVVNGLNTYMKGDNSPSINVSDVDKFYIPIPPIKEQLRIVSKIDILFNQLDLISQTLAD